MVRGLCSEAVSLLSSNSPHTTLTLFTLRAAANGPFTIYFFLSLSGEITTDPTRYGQSPHLAGLNHIFAAPCEVCSNCGDLEAAGQLVSDTSPITPLLLDYLNVPDDGLETGACQAFLSEIFEVEGRLCELFIFDFVLGLVGVRLTTGVAWECQGGSQRCAGFEDWC